MTGRSMNVLVIDDDEFIQTLLKESLESEGFNVLLAGSAEESYACIAKTLPDVIVMDIILPDKNGFDLCVDMRKRKDTASIPILMLSSKYTVSDRVYGLNVGADDYLVKPFHLEELNARVKALYRRAGAKTGEDTHRETPETTPDTAPTDILDDLEELEEPEEEAEIFEELKTETVVQPEKKPKKADSFDSRRDKALDLFRSNQLEEAFQDFNKLHRENPKNLEVKKYIEITRNQLMRKYIEAIGSKDSVPVRSSDRSEDFIGLDFSTEEGFMFSRIDGRSDCKGLVAMSGMNTLKGYGILYRLVKSGVIKIKR